MGTQRQTSAYQRPSRATPDPQDAKSVDIARNPALAHMEELTKERAWVDAAPFQAHLDRYGYVFLKNPDLEVVREVTAPHGYKVLSLFTGLGYAEAQMVAQGMDVLGFDREVSPNRWLLNTYPGPGEMDFTRFRERALFISFPDPTKKEFGRSAPVSFIERFLAAGGSTVITINEERPREHAIQCDQELVDFLERGRCTHQVPLRPWPAVMSFVGRGHRHNDFRPVLKVHGF